MATCGATPRPASPPSRRRAARIGSSRRATSTPLACPGGGFSAGCCAVIAGLRAATGDYVLVQDADLEYNPDEYAGLLKPVLDFGAELVMGSRSLAPPWTRVNYFWHMVGNRVITLLFNVLNNTTFTDV